MVKLKKTKRRAEGLVQKKINKLNHGCNDVMFNHRLTGNISFSAGEWIKMITE